MRAYRTQNCAVSSFSFQTSAFKKGVKSALMGCTHSNNINKNKMMVAKQVMIIKYLKQKTAIVNRIKIFFLNYKAIQYLDFPMKLYY